MPTTTSTGGTMSQRTNVWAAREMLKHAGPVMVLRKVAKQIAMPKNASRVAKFRRHLTFTAATTALTEGVTPDATVFGYEDVEVTINQYGDYTVITDVIEDTHEDPVLQDASLQQGENIGRTMEALDYAAFIGGTNVHFGNGSSRGDVNTAITINAQRAIVRSLLAQKARRITTIQDASINIGTEPIEAAWIAIGHSDLEADIRNLPGFIPVAAYGSRKPMCPEELGSVENVRYVLSPDLAPIPNAGGAHGGNVVTTDGTNADIYPLMFFGAEAVGCVALKGMSSVTPSIIPVGKLDKSDPLGQRGSVGWKSWHAALILNDAWMVRGEFGASAL